MKYTYQDLAGMIDHSLLHPTMTDADLEAGCAVAAKYQVASVCIRKLRRARRATELLRGTDVRVGCVIGFPHGGNTTEVKRFETETACRDGAIEIDMVINSGKALSGDWDYMSSRDVQAVCSEAHRHGAKVKVIFENDYLTKGGAGLTSDQFKIGALSNLRTRPEPIGRRRRPATDSSNSQTVPTTIKEPPNMI